MSYFSRSNLILARAADLHHLNADPDPIYYFARDLDPTFQFNADPDPAPHERDENLRPLAHRLSTAPF